MPTTRTRRRCIAALAVSAAGTTSLTSFWLAAGGTTSTGAVVPPGLTADGRVAEVTSISSTVDRMNGGATLSAGRTIGKVLVAKDYTKKVRISIAWLNPIDADRLLHNPHAQLRIGIYYPTSTTATGSCTNADAIAIVDGSTTFCSLRDTTARGSYSVASAELFLAQSILAGYLEPRLDGSGPLASCGVDADGPTAWCQPTAAYAGSAQRLLYLVAAITIPGGVPKGQQTQVGGLTFFLRASRGG